MSAFLFLMLTVFTSNVSTKTTNEALCVPMGSTNGLYQQTNDSHNKSLFGTKTVNANTYRMDNYQFNTIYKPADKKAEASASFGNSLFGGSAAAEGNTVPQQFAKNTAPTTGKQNYAQMAAKDPDHDPHNGYVCPDCGCNSSHTKDPITGLWYCASANGNGTEYHRNHKGEPCIHYNPPTSPIGNGTFVLLLLSLMYCLFRLVKGEVQEE